MGGVVLLLLAMGTITSQCMFVSQMAFFARVSDPAMGGTYMTLLNTLANLGGMWPPTVAFKLVDYMTCQKDTCMAKADGFYATSVLCFACGVIWWLFGVP